MKGRGFAGDRADTLIVIGGDDTLSYAVQLHRRGVSVMAIPKTMDNDVFGTDYCIGFSTAVSRSIELVQRLRTPSGSHERIAVIELFGRNCGETALMTGYLADADRTLIAEVPFEMQRLADLLARDRTNNPSNYAILVLSEGARFEGAEPFEAGPQDAYGHRKLGGLGERVGAAITRATGIDVLVQRLGYLMRAGPPDTLDQMVARNFGAMAMQHLADGKRGLMMALRAGIYTTVPIESCVQGVRRVDVRALYDIEAYRMHPSRQKAFPKRPKRKFALRRKRYWLMRSRRPCSVWEWTHPRMLHRQRRYRMRRSGGKPLLRPGQLS